MKTLTTAKKLIHNTDKRMVYALSFVLPFLSMLIIYALFQIFPFGDRTALVMDLNGQYADFFAYYHRVLTGNESLFYSFSKEMGGNVFGLFAYYLSSPFFLLALFFPASIMPEGIAFVTLLKIGSCGLSFAIFLRHVFKKTDWSVVLFSCAYALMTYSMHYSMCIMWLDGAIWLPIVLLGTERILQNKSGWCFLTAYALMLVSNYYTAYMNTLFIVIYFFFRYFTSGEKKNITDLLIKIGKMLGLGAVGVLLTVGILFPTFLDIFNGKMASGSYVAEGFWNIGIFNIARRLFIGQYDSITNSGNPNIFCGMLCGVMTGVFFFNPSIKIRTKVATLIVFAIFFVSFFIKRIDMAWHIFQYPNWYPYRYAYVFCFFAVMTAFRGFSEMDKSSKELTFTGIAVYALLLLSIWIWGRSVLTNITLAKVSFIFAAVYIAGIVLMKYKENLKPYICILLILFTCGELVLNGFTTISGLDKEHTFKSRSEYTEKSKMVNGMVDFLEEHDDGLYRAEKNFSRTDNDAMTFGYNGMTHYSSTYNNNIIRFNSSMGMLQEYILIRYMGSTALTDSLLGVKYVASENKVNDDYTSIHQEGRYSIYENPYALPLAFSADESALNQPAYSASALKNQDIFAASILGGSSYTTKVNASMSSGSIEFTASKSGTYYVDLKQKYEGTLSLSVNGQNTPYSYDANPKKIFCIGKYNQGDRISVKLSDPGNIKNPEVFCMDTDKLGKACISKKEDSGLNVTDYSNTWLEGTVSIGKGDILFTTIPYEKGWTAYVDGKKAEIVSAQNTFLAVRVSEGEHTIRLKYSVPGFSISMAISLITLAVIAFILRKKLFELIKMLWHIFSDIAYRITKAVLGKFNITITDEKWAALMQFVKFGLVGVMNTVIDYCSYLIALSIFNSLNLFGGMAYIPANFIGLAVSVTNAFYWNDKYVFAKSENEQRSKVKSFIKTFSSYAITGLGIKSILLYLFITVLGISDVLAPIIIMFIVVPMNFAMNKLWAFKTK